MKKLKTTNHPDEEEHNIVRRRPMRAALRPISPRSRNGASRGRAPPACPTSRPRCRRRRRHRLPVASLQATTALVPTASAAAAGRRSAAEAAVLLYRGGKRRQSFARPPARGESSPPLHCGTWLHLAHLWPVGRRTEDAPCVYKQGRPTTSRTSPRSDSADR